MKYNLYSPYLVSSKSGVQSQLERRTTVSGFIEAAVLQHTTTTKLNTDATLISNKPLITYWTKCIGKGRLTENRKTSTLRPMDT